MQNIHEGRRLWSDGKKQAGLALAVTAGAFALGPVLFAPAAGSPTPTSGQLPFFILLAVAEALVMGVAVAFAVFGRPAMRRLFSTTRRADGVHLAAVWALGSWWVHDNLHMANGTDLTGLLLIEYGFHVTLMAAAAFLVWALLAESRDRA